MAWTISPDHFDVVVIGSGLPECLVAASLVKSGKSVLIIDAVDTYGTDFASFTPAALQDALSKQQAAPPAPDAVTGDASNGLPTTRATPGEEQQPHEHEHSLPAQCSPVSEPLPSGWQLLRLSQRALPLSGIRALAAPAEGGGGPEDRRGYILDLVPKLVYQSEPLVDLLVRCRCHHYLEFKAVEGSYLLQEGALHPVPGGRADIFRDRRLSLGDKRVLMRFIQGCVEAQSGQGHLREALSSSRPLAEILAAEGLPPRLREVILYGIAMADTDQEPPAPSPPPSSSAESGDAASGDPSGSAATAASAAHCCSSGGVLTGAEGGAALELFTGSQGRFGAEGAFMLPSYGSGSVAEAFVRLCAVHGAVTVLRQPVQALAVAAEAEAEMVEAGATAEAEKEAQAGPAGPRVTAVVTAAGQVVRCGAVVAGTSTFSCLEGASASATAAEYVSRAVVVLDSPLLPAAAPATGAATGAGAGAGQQQPPKSLLTLVVPPRCQGAGRGGAGDLRNPHPVRALQEGASTCVCPAGRFLLYLSTPATSASSYDDLRPTLDSLVDTSALRDPNSTTTSTSTTTAAAATSPPGPPGPPSSTSGPSTDGVAAATGDQQPSPAPAAVSQSQLRPRALRAWFYRQPVLHRATATATTAAGSVAGRLPGGVVALPGPDGGLAGYNSVLQATEAVYRSAFPGVKWLSELDFSPSGGQAGGEGDEQEGGGADAAAAADDEDDDAIDELTAALARLKDG